MAFKRSAPVGCLLGSLQCSLMLLFQNTLLCFSVNGVFKEGENLGGPEHVPSSSYGLQRSLPLSILSLSNPTLAPKAIVLSLLCRKMLG